MQHRKEDATSSVTTSLLAPAHGTRTGAQQRTEVSDVWSMEWSACFSASSRCPLRTAALVRALDAPLGAPDSCRWGASAKISSSWWHMEEVLVSPAMLGGMSVAEEGEGPLAHASPGLTAATLCTQS
jgi:hypothetical protein